MLYLYNVDILSICMKEFYVKKRFDKITVMRAQTFFLYKCICIDSIFISQSTPTTAFDELIQYVNLHKVDILNICMKEFGAKIFFYKMTAMRTLTYFPI